MRRILFILTLLSVGVLACGQTGTGWFPERRKVNFKDSTYFAKDVNFLFPFRINGTAVTSNAAELNILDGALTTYTEINYLVGVTSAIQTQLNAKQATLVSGTNIKTVNGETVLGAGNIVISGEGGAMVYPGAGIPISTGTAWGTSLADRSAEWDTAYAARNRWSGSPIGLTAATGRTSLGGTTVGQSLFTLTNPDAIRFLRINADNTATALTAALFKTALSLTATDVSLGNVTNESKATMFTSPAFTGTATVETAITSSVAGIANLGSTTVPWSNLYIKDNGSIYFDTDDVYLYHPTVAPNELWMVGGAFRIQAGNLLMNSGSIGATAERVVKGWFTDLEVTNTITGTASLVTGFTRNAGTLTLSGGHGLTFTTTGTTALTLPTSGTLAVNPMTTAGDIVIGGASGVPTRLAAGTADYVLTMVAGAPAWAATEETTLGTRIDSIVTVLADTMNIEELLLIDLDTDTVADLSEVRLRVLLADSTDVYSTPTQIADSLNLIRTEIRDTVVFETEDINLIVTMQTDTIPLFVFGLGSGDAADTAVFKANAIAGAFYNAGSDTLMITSIRGVLAEGSGTESVSVQISWHATFKSGLAVNLNAAALAITSITTGTEDTSFANSTIPPDVWVWCTISALNLGDRPSMLILTMSGYKQNRSY